MSEGRRVRLIRISDVFLPQLFGAGRSHYEVIADAMPADARVVNCRLWGWTLDLLVESESFPVVPDGGPVPEMTPIFRTIDRPARIPFDVNGTVAVRLNDRGRAIYRLYYPRLGSPREDAAGRSRFQLHQLMAIFGPYVGVGFDPPFDTAIELEPGG